MNSIFTMNSIIKIVSALFIVVQMASAFVPSSQLATSTSLYSEKVVGIGGLGGIEIVGVDKLKSKTVSKKSKPKAVAKKAGGFKFPFKK